MMNKAIRSICVFVLLLTACSASLAADETSESNAAPMIMSLWDESRREYPRSRTIYEEIEGVELDGWVAGPAILSELMNDERLARIDRIIETGDCDSGLDYSQGPMLLLPHFGRIKTAMRLLLAKARIHINAG